MPISFSNLVEKSRTVMIPTNGGDLRVTYDPSQITTANSQALRDMDEDDTWKFLEMFAKVVTSWDIEGPFPIEDPDHSEYVPKGKQVPVEARYLAHVPTPTLSQIFTAVVEDATPKSPRSNSSKR